MEYQKMMKFLDNTPNLPEFRTENWSEISDDTRETHISNSQTKFKNKKLA